MYSVFNSMEPKDYTLAFEKYIERIIIPKFPEIKRFKVRLVDYFYLKNDEKQIPLIFIDFYKEPMFGSRLNKLEDELEQMKTYMSLIDDVRLDFNLFSANTPD